MQQRGKEEACGAQRDARGRLPEFLRGEQGVIVPGTAWPWARRSTKVREALRHFD